MPLKTLSLNGKWLLKDAKHTENDKPDLAAMRLSTADWMETRVPGDIHPTLEKEGRIPDPYMGKNAEECEWTAHCDWWHRREVKVPASFKDKQVFLTFDGVDTYATAYVNGEPVGEMNNAFVRYRFDVTKQIRTGANNVIAVCIKGTKSVIEKLPTKHYAACFYTPRVLARKAQCQFGWDWAPHLPALGIWEDVRLEAVSPGVIQDVWVRTKTDGSLHITTEIDRAARDMFQAGKPIKVRVEIRDGKTLAQRTFDAKNSVNFVNMKIDNPKLWWPNGYGDPNLYEYRVTLLNGKKELDQKVGTFGVRKVELVQEPVSDQEQSFRFRVNGLDVFCSGGNWVPADSFPGRVTRERYAHLVRLAHEAGFNMLRVWGGGIYEKDAFYDECDRKGIMIWQDLMFACADIPDDNLEWTRGLVPEFEHQVKRLRNHPCMAHWCGGNEKTGAFSDLVQYGEFTTRYLGRGVVQQLMPDLDYSPCSPHGLTDVGNDMTSGDTHGGRWEEAFHDDIRKFRKHIDVKQCMFMSEFGLHGPPQMRSLEKFMPEDALWPINDTWEFRVQDNPYNSLKESFVQVQEKSAEILFHKPESAADFVKTAGTFYAEFLGAEMQHHRRRWPANGAGLTWMFDDTWPCASWSMVDYYGLPKQVYYALKRAVAPLAMSFREVSGGYELYLVHRTQKPVTGTLRVSLETVDGSDARQIARRKVSVPANDSKIILNLSRRDIPKVANSYVVARYEGNAGEVEEIFFHDLWKDIDWPEPGLKVRRGQLREKDGEYEATLTFETKRFARCVNIKMDRDVNPFLSDNFFDMTPGSKKRVIVRCPKRFDPKKIEGRHWLEEWD